MDLREALAFVEKHGIVLMAAHGPVPTLTDTLAGEHVRGSWWGHPKSHEIFQVLGLLRDSGEVATCRLVRGKVTFVHRRLWPALIRLEDRFPRGSLDAIREEHTAKGSHRVITTPLSDWIPKASAAAGRRLSVAGAISQVGPDLLNAISGVKRRPRSERVTS